MSQDHGVEKVSRPEAVQADTAVADSLGDHEIDPGAAREMRLAAEQDRQLPATNEGTVNLGGGLDELDEEPAAAAEADSEGDRSSRDAGAEDAAQRTAADAKSKDATAADGAVQDGRELGAGAGTRKQEVPQARAEQGKPVAAEKQRDCLQDFASRPYSVRTQVSEVARSEPDFHSRWNEAPRPDNRGVDAAARVFVERELAKRDDETQSDAPAPQADPQTGEADATLPAEAEGDVPPQTAAAKTEAESVESAAGATKSNPPAATDTSPTEEGPAQDKSVVWAFTHTGLEPRRFMETVVAQDSSGTVANSTRLVIACDSAAKEAAIRKSGYFAEGTEYQVIDPAHPDFQLPDNTAVALLPETLSEQPAHTVVKFPNGEMLEWQNRTELQGKQPFVAINEDGEAATVNPSLFGKYHAAYSQAVMRGFAPQLAGGRLVESDVNPEDGQTKLMRLNAVPPLAGVDASVARFLANGQPNRGYNYSGEVEALVRTVTDGVAQDGIVVINDIMRDALQGKAARVQTGALQEVHGPFVNNVVEATSVRTGALQADPRASIDVVNPQPGGMGYVLIDRSKDGGQVAAAQQAFHEVVAPDFTPELQQQSALEGQLMELRQRLDQPGADHAALARQMDDIYTQLETVAPDTGRDYATALMRSQLANISGQSEAALEHARHATELAPHFSAPYVELAKAELANGRLNEAATALNEAHHISPTNPAVHEAVIDAMLTYPDLKAANLERYQEALVNYVRYAPEPNPRMVAGALRQICETQEVLKWQQHQDDDTPVKTFLRENLETGELTEDHLTAAELGQIEAADLWRANGAVVSELLSHGQWTEPQRAAMNLFLDGYARTVPRDDSGNPLPRDQWRDMAQGRVERLRVLGDMHQTDAELPPDELLTWRDASERARTSITLDDGAIPPELARITERPVMPRSSIVLGQYLDTAGDTIGSGCEIPVEGLPGHGVIVSKTGGGKTTTIEAMLEQIPGLQNEAGEDVHFWAVELGDKRELEEKVDALKAKGIPVTVIKVGDENEVPVSLDIFTPVGPVEEHIGRLTDMWIMAYGGGGNSPVRSIVSSAFRYVYAANGHSIELKEKDLKPGERLPVATDEPTTPSSQEFLAACKRRAQYEKGTDARNLLHYFDKREEDLSTGHLGEFLVGKNGLKMGELIKTNVIFSFARLTEEDQKRMAYVALCTQANSQFQNHEGLSDHPKLVVAVDEPDIIIKNARQTEAQEARSEAVKAYAGYLRRVRGYGLSYWHLTQTLEDVDPVVLSQTRFKIALPLDDENDKRRVLNSMGVEGEKFDQLFGQLSRQEAGTAVIKDGTSDVQTVKIRRSDKPSDRALALARQWHVPPPVKENPYNGFTYAERRDAAVAAQAPDRDLQRVFLGAVTMAHVGAGTRSGAAIPLPSRVPPALQQQWSTGLQQRPRQEVLTLLTMADNQVNARTEAIRTVYPPHYLARSVVSHSVSLLNGNPGAGGYVSSAFGLPQVQNAAEMRRLEGADFDRAPNPTTVAWPLPQGSLSGANNFRNRAPAAAGDMHRRPQNAAEQLEGLRRHPASPTLYQGQNAKLAMIGLLGQDDGNRLFQDIFEASERNPNRREGRRDVAVELGYGNDPHTPRRTALEEALFLGYYICDLAKRDGDA